MSYLSRNNFYPKLYINGDRAADTLISGAEVVVRRAENENASMQVKLRPSAGAQNFAAYQGLPIILDVQTSATNTYRVFTGIIDIDEYDILNESLTLYCTDNRENKVLADSAFVSGIGYYDEAIFGIAIDKNDELAKRLTTIPYAYDYDVFGNGRLTAWAAKGSADYTLGDSDIYIKSLSVQRTQRSKIVNTVNINFKYSFDRLHHREMNYVWNSGVTVCQFLTYGYSLCSKDMVRQASAAVGWPLRSGIGFTGVYTSGLYRCDGVSLGWEGTTNEGINYVNQQEQVVNGASTQVTKYDAAGNPIIQSATTNTSSTAYSYCIGAAWIATTRFTQNMVENYTLTVTAPQSTAQWGAINSTVNHSLTDSFDAGYWEDYRAYSSQPSGATNLVNNIGDTVSDYIIDKDTQRANSNAAILTAINKAKTTILKSHRENTVQFDRNFWPQIDLYHTVALSCTKLTAKGKVKSVTHVINITDGGESHTEVQLALSTSVGSTSDSTLAVPTKPTYTPVRYNGTVALQSHYGVDPSTTAAQSWTGHIGNRWVIERNNYFRTSYQEAFIVDAPAIEEQFRDDKNLYASQSYNISIPNDTLSITYTGKPHE